ncbi:uncharacterized protein LOC135130759 [Zophobas morio]|uniref:uncharacterized protein LOC135130759 n=1 Tax=Zophobas morio TaxID=2755281 RepID=UPI003082CFFF
MYNKKSNGPKIEPCGTPMLTIVISEYTLLNRTTCWRLWRKLKISSFDRSQNVHPKNCFVSKQVRFSPIQQTKKSSNRENRRTLGPYELAQQQFSKFCPLTIIKKPLSQGNSTPKQKSILTYVRPSQDSPKSHKSASFEGLGPRKPCIACSRVSKEQVIAISSLTNKKLASYSTSFTPKVTRLIVATNDKNCLKDHTIKFVSAVASGAWVLNFRWVQQCLAKNALVPEEPFEVLDVSGAPGPQRSRLNRSTKPLFKGYKIHAAAPFASTTQQEVESVVRLLGGKVVPSPEHLLDKHGFVCVIVTEARATQDFELYETWLEALKVVTVDIEWLSRSVGQYNLLSLRPFTLCSDDTIDNLGYPPELTANMTYSFSQQTFSSVPSST